MKHKILALSAAFALILLPFSGCRTAEESGSSPSQSGIDRTLAGESFDRHDGLPPLNDTLKEVYKEAAERYITVTYLQLDTDEGSGENGPDFIEIDGTEDYVRVTDDRFSTVAELKAYLGESFTDDYVTQNWFTADSKLFRDYNGALYVLPYGNSPDHLFRGQTFMVTKATGTEIDFTAHIYRARMGEDRKEDAPLFFKEPDDPQNYEIADAPFSMVKCGDGAWRFKVFSDVSPAVQARFR